PLTGTYTVLITPASNTTGSIQFTLWKDVEGGELALDMPKSVTTVYRQQLARLTFSGTASDSTLGMEVKGVTLPAGSSFVVRRPDGNTLPTGASSGLGNTTSVDPTSKLFPYTTLFRSPLTGTYTVLITPASNTTGSIQFTLWKDVDTG